MASGNNVARRVIKLAQQQPEQQHQQWINEQPAKCARLHLLIYAPVYFLNFFLPTLAEALALLLIPHRPDATDYWHLNFAALAINQSGILASFGIPLTATFLSCFCRIS